MKKLTIKRSEWLHGEGPGASYLLRPTDGKKCCLGILATDCGATDEQILDKKSPADCRNIKWVDGLLQGQESNDLSDQITNTCVNIMSWNDALCIYESRREEILTKYFQLIDIEVEFVN